MKMRAFWDIAPFSVNVSEVSTASIVRVMMIVTPMMDVVRTSETSVYSNETTRHYIPEYYHLHTRRREPEI
jgi:hypothetical protein